MEDRIFLLLGGNQGNRFQYLTEARMKIDGQLGIVMASSSVYCTAAWGDTDQNDFYNQALEIRSAHQPIEALKEIHAIEKKLGRVRENRWGPRVIDIDILLWGTEIINLPDLKIPHPELPNRRFALAPLAEIASEIVHPVLRKTIAQLLEDCPDKLPVGKVKL